MLYKASILQLTLVEAISCRHDRYSDHRLLPDRRPGTVTRHYPVGPRPHNKKAPQIQQTGRTLRKSEVLDLR